MAVVFLNPQDGILSYRADLEEEKRNPLPAGTDNLVRFDKATNLQLYRDIQARTESYTLVGGQLRKNNVPVTLNPPGRGYEDAQEILKLDQMINRWLQPGPALDSDSLRLALLHLA